MNNDINALNMIEKYIEMTKQDFKSPISVLEMRCMSLWLQLWPKQQIFNIILNHFKHRTDFVDSVAAKNLDFSALWL